MSAGARDFERALGGLLAANVFEIDMKLLRLIQELSGIDLQARDAIAGVDQMNDFQQSFDRIDFNIAHHGGLAGVDFGDDETPHFRPARLDRDRQGSSNPANPSVEREFADE